MSHAYQAVGWNRQKRIYDFTLLGLVLLAVSVFGTVTALRHPTSGSANVEVAASACLCRLCTAARARPSRHRAVGTRLGFPGIDGAWFFRTSDPASHGGSEGAPY